MVMLTISSRRDNSAEISVVYMKRPIVRCSVRLSSAFIRSSTWRSQCVTFCGVRNDGVSRNARV